MNINFGTVQVPLEAVKGIESSWPLKAGNPNHRYITWNNADDPSKGGTLNLPFTRRTAGLIFTVDGDTVTFSNHQPQIFPDSEDNTVSDQALKIWLINQTVPAEQITFVKETEN